jgi:GT2 family glycosyltransferase
MKKLTIIMVAMNQLALTQRAIESLVKHTDKNQYKLMFFDNGSTDNTESWVSCFCRDKGIELKYQGSSENRGYIGAVNKGYDMCDTAYSLTCHNDVIFCKQWLENMMRRFKDPEVGAVGPMISFAMGPQSYNYSNFMNCDVRYLLGLFFLADMNVLRTVKEKYGEILPVVYGLGDKEELELCYRILQLGFKFEIARDVHIDHEGEKGFIETLGSQQAFYDYQEKQKQIIYERLGKTVVDNMFQLTTSKPIKLMIGILTRTEYVHYQNVISLLKIWGATPVAKTFYHVARGHPEDRNEIIKEFLKGDCTHILFIDDDQVFEQDAVFKLLEHDVDICTGITWMRGEPHAPCIFLADHEKKQIHPIEAEGGLIEIDACGGYFLLIKREVLETLEFPWFKYGDTSMNYNMEGDRQGVGEDVAFGLKARLAGFEMYCDSDLEITHLGQVHQINRKFVREYRDSGKQAEFIKNKFQKM